MSEQLQNDVTHALQKMREQIDRIDHEILNLFNERLMVSETIGLLKFKHNIAVVQNNRFEQIITKMIEESEELNISEAFIRTYLQAMHTESIRRQEELQRSLI